MQLERELSEHVRAAVRGIGDRRRLHCIVLRERSIRSGLSHSAIMPRLTSTSAWSSVNVIATASPVSESSTTGMRRRQADGPAQTVSCPGPRYRQRAPAERSARANPPGAPTYAKPYSRPEARAIDGAQWPSSPTAKETTRTESIRAETDSTAINSLARTVNGMVSVGLKAEELVTDTNR